jgi:hypothetical protein
MDYVLKCEGKNRRGETVNVLTAGGVFVHKGSYGEAYRIVRRRIKPGDTYTEGGAVLSYEQMQKQYADGDAFDRGEF